jgi:two-component system response regulator AtoC
MEEAFRMGTRDVAGELQSGRAALVVHDPKANALSDLVVGLAQSDLTILLRGETGVGKEVLASSLHSVSARPGPLVGINCAALPESLLESELFGHERGAFTGAVQSRAGLFEAAAGGTLFLDEVGDMPPAVQAKLLRSIETRQVLRVGGRHPVQVDVRFIAATHRDLRADVAKGAFRRDLYFRLNGITLTIPPLRERRDAIAGLAGQFAAASASRIGRRAPLLSESALDVLVRHDWPGNIRELKTVMERAVLLCRGDELEEGQIVIDPPLDDPPASSEHAAARHARASGERDRILNALAQCNGNQSRAAKVLGVSRATLAHKLAVHRIPRPRAG